ncbi:MAG: hypothetical protein KAT28_04215 [Candidatus Aenigmarchaeota archaeon]|nr:hypothetical protein [Candidatus Aenigmarchaeota archaeon]
MEMALKSLNPSNLFYSIFGHNGDSVLEKEPMNSKYPLDELKKYVGEVIEVYHIDREPEKSVLKFAPGKEFFYLETNDDYSKNGDLKGHHIVYWDRTHPNGGGRSAVILIKDEAGNELYRNDELFFEVEE